MTPNKVHCFFEQSGTFKNEFIKLGIPAYDYDILNNYNETDYVIDLFAEIEKAYNGCQSLFDDINNDDLIIAFFPCIHFCDAKTLAFKGVSIFFRNKEIHDIMDWNIKESKTRELFYRTLLKLVSIASKRKLALIIENPWNDSGETYLQRNFIKPTIIDRNRTLRGDYYVKPTGYWFICCEPTIGYSYQKNNDVRIVYKQRDKRKVKKGHCSEVRSLISPNYARNFICDFILGKIQKHTEITLFYYTNNVDIRERSTAPFFVPRHHLNNYHFSKTLFFIIFLSHLSQNKKSNI